MKIEQDVKIHNRFDIEVRDSITGELKQTAQAENILLDSIYTRLCGGSTYFVNIHFGTGTGVPVATRTSLFTHLGTKTAVDEELVKAIPLSSWKRKIVLAPEEYVGQTITEVGIAWGSTATYLMTHAMIKDAEGNPISITKTATDVITIYATVFVTFSTAIPELKWMGLPNSNTLMNYLIGGAAAPSGSFGLRGYELSYGRLGSTSIASWISDAANKKRKTDVKRFDINTGTGNVMALDFTNMFTLALPATGIFSGQPYIAVPIGTGDGVKTLFEIPSNNIQGGMLDIKIDGIVTTALTSSVVGGGITDLITPPNLKALTSVALSSDATVLAVATGNSSSYVQIYDWNNGWTERPTPPNMPDNGYSVALSSDGTVLAVGTSTFSPYVKIYDWNNGWTERPTPSNVPANGYSVALSSDGTVLAVATRDLAPRVKIYDWNAGWTERPTPSNVPTSNALSVALSSDGTVLAVATLGTPIVKIYDWNAGWTERPTPPNLPITQYYVSVSLSSDGTVLAISAYNAPYVKVYDWNAGWTARPTPPSVSAPSGQSVALSSDGTVLAVAMSNYAPYVTISDWNNGWTERPTPPEIPSTSYYVNAVALSSDATVLAVATYAYGPFVKVYDWNIQEKTIVDFTTPPAIGVALTADYTVKGVHKTVNQVIDVSFAIQFGEGV